MRGWGQGIFHDSALLEGVTCCLCSKCSERTLTPIIKGMDHNLSCMGCIFDLGSSLGA